MVIIFVSLIRFSVNPCESEIFIFEKVFITVLIFVLSQFRLLITILCVLLLLLLLFLLSVFLVALSILVNIASFVFLLHSLNYACSSL